MTIWKSSIIFFHAKHCNASWPAMREGSPTNKYVVSVINVLVDSTKRLETASWTLIGETSAKTRERKMRQNTDWQWIWIYVHASAEDGADLWIADGWVGTNHIATSNLDKLDTNFCFHQQNPSNEWHNLEHYVDNDIYWNHCPTCTLMPLYQPYPQPHMQNAPSAYFCI